MFSAPKPAGCPRALEHSLMTRPARPTVQTKARGPTSRYVPRTVTCCSRFLVGTTNCAAGTFSDVGRDWPSKFGAVRTASGQQRNSDIVQRIMQQAAVAPTPLQPSIFSFRSNSDNLAGPRRCSAPRESATCALLSYDIPSLKPRRLPGGVSPFSSNFTNGQSPSELR